MNKTKRKKGFTLLEILLVVAALGILAGIVIIAINPSKQMGDTRDAQRKVDVNTIINAVYQYAVDKGSIPAGITTTEKEICKTGATCTGLVDLSTDLLVPTYIAGMPYDPSQSTTNGTAYKIIKTADNRVTVTATPERASSISVTR